MNSKYALAFTAFSLFTVTACNPLVGDPTTSADYNPGVSTITTVGVVTVSAMTHTTASVTVTLLDSGNNPISGKIVSLSSNRGATDVITPASGTSDANGQVIFSVTTTAAGAAIFSATDVTDSNLVLASTATVTFAGPNASAGSSSILSFPDSVAADGSSTAAVVVTLIDSFGHPVSNRSVTLSSGRGGATDTISAPALTDASGHAAFTVKSSTLGFATLSASDTTDAVSITQTLPILFLSATPTLDYQGPLANAGVSAGNNALPVSTWKNLASSAATNDAALNGFAYNVADGWAGTGSTVAPYSLVFNGSSYVDSSTAINAANSATLETWLNTTSTTRGAVIASNGLIGGTFPAAETNTGMTLKESISHPGQVELTLGTKSYTDEVLADSPIGYWKLDETSGTTAFDRSGAGTLHNGTYLGAYTQGAAGAIVNESNNKALAVNGGGYVDIGNMGAFPNQGTIEFWMNSAAVVNYNNAFSTNGFGNNNAIRYEQSNGGGFGVACDDGSNNFRCGVGYSPISAGQWYHVIMTWDKIAGVSYGYLNGVLTSTTSGIPGGWPTGLIDVTIGVGFNNTRYFQGSMDEVAMYNTPLSAARIQAHYNARLRTSCLSQSVISNGVWNDITGVFDVAGPTLKLYVNGTSECSVTNASAVYSNASNPALRIGADASGVNAFTGSISDFRGYGSALSGGAVLNNFTAESPKF